MKNLWIALFFLITVSACLPEKIGKKDDPEPAPELAGTYQVRQFTDARFTPPTYDLPYTRDDGRRFTAIVVVSRLSDTEISFRIETYLNGQLNEKDSPVTVTIQKSSGQNYDIINGSERVGSINGTNFSLDYTESGYRFAISASK